jgi:hypothetical protein
MTQHRKPIPKSQKELANQMVKPYVNPETGETLGNPNDPSNYKQFTDKSQAGVGFNRGEKLSLKGDTEKPFTVHLQDLDEAVLYYFDEVIQPHVIQNGERIKVPLIYGSPERFKTIQKDGFLRDKSGKMMMPIAMFKRDSLENKRNISQKVDAGDPKLYVAFQAGWNHKNAYSNFEVLNNKIPTKKFVASVIPDYVTLTYSFIIQTYYVEQLNKIVEAINYAADSYWGDPERYRFKAKIDTFNTTTEINQGENRIVRSTFTLRLHGYIIPDVLQKDINAVKKYNTKSKVIFGVETVNGEFFDQPTPNVNNISNIIDNQSPIINYIDPMIVNYLNTNIQKLGTYVDSTTVTFNSGWLASPSTLPATSLNNFTIFFNGQLIEEAAIVSFTESGGVTTLVIDEVELGYSISPTDEILAIGKFSN